MGDDGKKHDKDCEEKCRDEKHEVKYDDGCKEEGVKEHGKESGGYKEEDGKFAGIHFSKKDLLLAAGGAAGVLALLGLGKCAGKLRPVAVGAVREGYAFKEWVAGRFEEVREDVEDIVAEGVHQYRQDVESAAETVKREKDILEKVAKMVDERLTRLNEEKGGA